MDDADDETRTLIFNMLANLPEKTLKTIRYALDATKNDHPDVRNLLAIVTEIVPFTGRPVKGLPQLDTDQWIKDNVELDRVAEHRLNAYWDQNTEQWKRHVWAEWHGLAQHIADEEDIDVIHGWWTRLTFLGKREALRTAGINPDEV